MKTSGLLEKISDKLVERFPNRLPTKEISSYELGVLVGQQEVLKQFFALLEKELNETSDVRQK